MKRLVDAMHPRGAAPSRGQAFTLLACTLLTLLPRGAEAQVNVWTQHNDNARTGANLSETALTTSTVNSNTFGRLFTYVVDGDIYAQPLVIRGVSIAGKGSHNVVFVATMNNSVYAFDADSNQGANAQPLWQVNFNNPANGVTPVPAQDIGLTGNVRNPGPVGVMGTPVIDALTNTMYLIARTKEVVGGVTSYLQRLHALDIRSGAEKFGGPVVIQASVPGTGYDAAAGFVSFNPKTENQRSALALNGGVVYAAWASLEDRDPYHGWIIGYDAATLQQRGALCLTPNGSKGGIWQAGQAPAIDSNGDLYFTLGNGTFTAAQGGLDYGESLIKVSADLTSVVDWFAPDNWEFLNAADFDFGSSGPVLLPGTNFVISGGKEGRFFLLDRASLGQLAPGNAQILQDFQATSGGHIHGSPVFWNGPAGPLLYVWGETDRLKAFRLGGIGFDTTPVTQSTFTAPPGMPGGILSVSANGNQAGSGILWAALPQSGDAEQGVVPGVLRAFDASDLTRELWNSRQNAIRDDVGNFAKFVPPTVANGRVYLATFSNRLQVYGLFSSVPHPPGGALTVSATASSSPLNLTSVGTTDWAHWPGYDHKASGGGFISDYAVIGSNSATIYSNDMRTISWSDGTPTVNGSNSQGVFINGRDFNGFRFSVAADTTPRTLNVYVAGWNSAGLLTAYLSDGSAPEYRDQSFSASGQYDAVYTLNFHAASAGQRLYVEWTQWSVSGNVDLQAAALSGGATPPAPPTGVAASDGTSSTSVAVTWTAVSGALSYSVYRSTTLGVTGTLVGAPTTPSFTDTTVTPGTTYYYGVTVTTANGTSTLSTQNSGFASAPVSPPAPPTGVAASDGTSATSVTVTWTAVSGATSYSVYRSTTLGVTGTLVGAPTTASFTDATVTPGTTYYYGVTVTTGSGTSTVSTQDSGFAVVPSGTGTLTGTVLTPTSPVNLTTVGTSDWAHWPNYDHKATGGSQISAATLTGPGTLAAYADDPRTLTWSDGTPTASGANAAGVYVGTLGTGLRFSAPASPTMRTLTVYVGGWNSTGQLTAHLSDGSALDYVSPLLGAAGQYDGVYSLTYQAATAGAQLVVSWVQAAGSGNVTLQAAALK